MIDGNRGPVSSGECRESDRGIVAVVDTGDIEDMESNGRARGGGCGGWFAKGVAAVVGMGKGRATRGFEVEFDLLGSIPLIRTPSGVSVVSDPPLFEAAASYMVVR